MALNELEFRQKSIAIQSDGNEGVQYGTRSRAAFVADLIQQWTMAGYVWHMTIGGVTGGGDVALITGGGAGTVIDQDQPEGIVSITSSDFFLVPIKIDVDCQVDMDADGEEGNIVVTADRAAATAAVAGTNNTAETPSNLLDNGDSVPGTAVTASAQTADITDPTVTDVLKYATTQGSEFVSNGTATNLTNGIAVQLSLRYNARDDGLYFIRGPGAFYVYWGGTAAVPGMATIQFAVLPSSMVV